MEDLDVDIDVDSPSISAGLDLNAVGVCAGQYLDFSCGVLGQPVLTFPGRPLN